jgi:hypothetical protein
VSQTIVIYDGPDACSKCLGWKRVANDDDQTPWKYWAELPSPNNLSVQLGLVYPVTCPTCLGTGRDIRETLGRVVRDAWIAWAKEQKETKDSWFSPWEELGEPFKEADRRIGMAVLDFLHAMAEENP